eukprot:6621-Eustigmatos_ZCMA.PRE.1
MGARSATPTNRSGLQDPAWTKAVDTCYHCFKQTRRQMCSGVMHPEVQRTHSSQQRGAHWS